VSLPGSEPRDPGRDVEADARRTMARGSLAMLSIQPLSWAAALAAAVIVPRSLGADGLGRFTIAWSIAFLAGTITSAGLPQFITRRVATEPGRAAEYAWGGLVTVALSTLVIASGLMLAVLVLRPTAIDTTVLMIGIVGVMMIAAQSVMNSVLMGIGRHARFAFSSISFTILGAIFGLGALLLGGGAHGYALGLLTGWAIATGILWRTSGLKPGLEVVNPRLLRELLVGGLPFAGYNVALAIRGQTDIALTGLLLQPNVAGWLAAAYRIINAIVFIPTVITTPLMPALSRARAVPDAYRALLRSSVAMVLFLTVPVSATLFVLAPVIPGVLGWPTELEHAVPLIMILAFQQTLIGLDMVLGTSLIALGLEHAWLRVAVFGAIFNPGLNLVVLPLAQSLTGNGAIGAAGVEVTTELIFLGCAVALMPRGLLGRDTANVAARTITCGLVLVATAALLRPFGLVVAVVLADIAYLVAAVGLGVLRPRQLRAVRLALRGGVAA
jgi:O-antigen/teichoic acid export membrane protein